MNSNTGRRILPSRVLLQALALPIHFERYIVLSLSHFPVSKKLGRSECRWTGVGYIAKTIF